MMSEFYEEKRNPSKDYANRYKDCGVLIDKETGEVLLATRELKDIYVSADDTYHRLQHHELNRLDILAQEYYQNPNLWWVIAEANSITDPFSEMEVGTLLRIPSITTLYGSKGFLL